MDLNPWHQPAKHSSPSEAMWPVHQSYASEGLYPAARLLESMQLLPQQASMAAMLPHAIVNKDIFPCKACGIWFRSERNHQAHLLFYCSGRQNPDQNQTPEPFSTLPHHMTLPYPQGLGVGQGQQAVEMLLNIHDGVKREGPAGSGGWGLRCTVCEHAADSPASLQHHILSHLSSSGHLCPLCHLSFQTAGDLDTHARTHTHRPGTRAHPADRHCAGAGSPQQASKCETGGGKEAETEKGMGKEGFQRVQTRRPGKPEKLQQVHALLKQERPDFTPSPASRPPSCTSTPTPLSQVQLPRPRSTPPGPRSSRAHPQIKSEPSSPRPTSSPIHPSLRPAFPLPHFLPHFPFLQDMTSPTGPQASEILAKMSELVHHRLRQGAGGGPGGNNNYPSLLYSPGHGPVLSKGTTCFQCSISFSSLENYLVHKKHYCQGRWTPSRPRDCPALLDKLPAPGSPEAGSRAGMASLGVGGAPSDPTSSLLTPPGLAVAGLDLLSTDRKWEGKTTPPRTPPDLDEKPCVQGEMEGAEGEGDLPGKTTCQACKITFSRTENFLVHKRYYCATRHDPPARRNHGNKMAASAAQRTVRTRRRRKNFDASHLANQELRLPLTHPRFLGIGPIGGAGMYQGAGDVFGTHGNQFPHPRYGLFLGVEPKHPEASLPTPRSALSSRCNSLVQSELATPPTDTPMDLSRKQAWRPGAGKVASAQIPRMHHGRDYHECVPCQVNFDRVEDYLQHKHSSCPAQGKRGRAGPASESPGSGPGSGSEEAENHGGRGGLTLKSRHAPVQPTCSPPPSKKPRSEGEPP
ncbi:zinc finger protein ZFPM2-like [Hypomesus transpacificus]|uniref:zinc finger protein ZFPM2-like n=1 Tax=Hypomesus transpacificus TaxID=137520 RepID=UPI001F08502E|nr:zinc finger protein ZFPM2-like [Hypomesus transpacificus]